tara:strand:+ start:766 stop:2502 length:1737 start_codon:yes stop_codon:yes gene_type:complete
MQQENNMQLILNKVFGFKEFKPNQKEIIDAVMSGNDCLAVLPTGAGKSLTFQIPALLKPGVTFVISPLVSLMKDQVDQLKKVGISAAYINSTLSFVELRKTLTMTANQRFKLVYIAPERIHSRSFQFVYNHLLKKESIALLAVDEAHCLSHWGHDFRPSYRQIKELRKSNNIPVLAVTATATQKVRDDITRELQFNNNAVIQIGMLDRPNLKYSVKQVLKKEDSLIEFLKNKQKRKGIIFCATRKSTKMVYSLCQSFNPSVGIYHGGLSDYDRRKVQDNFFKGKLNWIVATNAFGMGVNLSNLRFILHFEMPGSIEQYIQETGRAGRDGKNAECLILYGLSDRKIHEFFIANSQPDAYISKHMIEFFERQEYPLELSDHELREKLSSIDEKIEGGKLLRYLQLLEDLSMISWVNKGQKRVFSLNAQFDALQLPMGVLDDKVNEARRKLDLMEDFCLRESCLRESIQQYFQTNPTECGNCSHCLNEHQIRVDSKGPVAQQIYAALETHPMRYGISTIAELLCGGRSQGLFDRNLHDCDHYGVLSGHSQIEIREYITRLIHKGAISRTNDNFPKIGLPRI